jgi:hypothetical protein
MRYRICPNNGLGTSEKPILNNKGQINKDFADDAINQYFENWGGFDFEINDESIAIGIEPTYYNDPLKIITIANKKENSNIRTGISFGHYGSNVVSKSKSYKDYKNKSKFVKFIDKWHPILFGEK